MIDAIGNYRDYRNYRYYRYYRYYRNYRNYRYYRNYSWDVFIGTASFTKTLCLPRD